MSRFTDDDLRAILNRECRGLLESNLPWSANDIVDDMAKELLYRREEAEKNDVYIEKLERRLEPCTCESGKCLQHDD
jgi:hypothetical protein